MNVMSPIDAQYTSHAAVRNPWFVITAIIVLAAVAGGVSYSPLFRIALLFLVIGAYFKIDTKWQSSGMRFLFVSLGLSLAALAWVLTVSTDKLWWKFLVIIAWMLVMRALRHFHVDLTNRSTIRIDSGLDFGALYVAVPTVLTAQGWTHFVPLVISSVVTTLVLAVLRHRVIRFPVKILLITLNVAGALISRQWLARDDIRVFLSFDQNFRASLATGLTRWGWTDWNAAAGHPVRYHWLSEATAGLFSRLTGIDEFDSVVRLIPIIGIVGALLLGATLLQKLGVAPLPAWAAAALTVGLQKPFSVFSIGTLWGAFLGFGVLTILAILVVGKEAIRLSINHTAAITAICVLVLMSQSSVGVTVTFVVAVAHLVLVIRGRVALLGVLALGAVLATALGVVSQTLLRSPRETPFQVTRIPFLYHGIIGLPNSFKEAFSPWVEPYSQSLLVPMFLISVAVGCVLIRSHERGKAILFAGSYVFAAWLAINLIRIGGHEERFVREGLVVASLFGVGGFLSLMSGSPTPLRRVFVLTLVVAVAVGTGRYWQDERSPTTYIWVHLTVIAVTLMLLVIQKRSGAAFLASTVISGLLAGTILGFFHESAERSLAIASRSLPPLSSVNGDRDVNECLNWMRRNTPPETTVASNMWRIPNGEEEKYFLVSQKTKRRVIVDGPDYVRNVGAYADESELEDLKNVVDDFVGTPTVSRLYALRATGAAYLIVDMRRPHSSRLASYSPMIMSTAACAVHRL